MDRFGKVLIDGKGVDCDSNWIMTIVPSTSGAVSNSHTSSIINGMSFLNAVLSKNGYPKQFVSTDRKNFRTLINLRFRYTLCYCKLAV